VCDPTPTFSIQSGDLRNDPSRRVGRTVVCAACGIGQPAPGGPAPPGIAALLAAVGPRGVCKWVAALRAVAKRAGRFRRCEWCKETKYCSENCQRAHSDAHRPECLPVVDPIEWADDGSAAVWRAVPPGSVSGGSESWETSMGSAAPATVERGGTSEGGDGEGYECLPVGGPLPASGQAAATARTSASTSAS
jgi:hypothetical protein